MNGLTALPRRTQLCVLLLSALVTALAAAPSRGSTVEAPSPESYGWPVEPFDAEHPIRSTFGDPRTRFTGQPTHTTLYHGGGSFSFHAGVDIVASDRTPVYAVRSGTVIAARAAKVVVDSGGGVGFQYWHIEPAVGVGDHVEARTTVLGHVRDHYGHVHLAETERGRAVNPLRPGHLTPYADQTTPRIAQVGFRRPGTFEEVLPELVRGRVEIVVTAQDDPQLEVPPAWALMSSVPAVVSWRLDRVRDGRVVVRDRVVFDARKRVPQTAAFWRVFGRGTRQNMPTFGGHRYWRQPGRFLFRLGVLDTRQLEDGVHVITVSAGDVRGNRATERTAFRVRNAPGWPPPTPGN